MITSTCARDIAAIRFVVDLEEQVNLAAEVVVDAALGAAKNLGHVVDAGGGIALEHEGLRRGPQQRCGQIEVAWLRRRAARTGAAVDSAARLGLRRHAHAAAPIDSARIARAISSRWISDVPS
jgi:hypothetical protein